MNELLFSVACVISALTPNQAIENIDKVVACEILNVEGTVIVAYISEPIYFRSEIETLNKNIADTLNQNYGYGTIYVTRDGDIYYDIARCNKIEENEKIVSSVIKKVSKRQVAYEYSGDNLQEEKELSAEQAGN